MELERESNRLYVHMCAVCCDVDGVYSALLL